MKDVFKYLWLCKTQVGYLWLFLSLLSLCDKTKYTIPITLLIDGVISIIFCLIVIIIIKLENKYLKK